MLQNGPIKDFPTQPWRRFLRAGRLARFARVGLYILLGLGAIFCATVVIQAQINKEEYANQAAETLRKIIGFDNVCRLEYAVFSLDKKYHKYFPRQRGKADPKVAAWLSSANRPYKQAEGNQPVNLEPLVATPASPGEGQWRRLDRRINGLWRTFIRPSSADPDRAVHLVAIDQRCLGLYYVPGTELTKSESLSQIPATDRSQLIAIFNGGFRRDYRDEIGQRKAGKEYRPISKNKGTIIMDDGGVRICRWEEALAGQYPTADLRQNLAPLLENGQINEQVLHFLETKHLDFPCRRTGLGQTTDRRWLIFAGGDRMEPDDVAVALQLASCVNAVHLDQNRGNVFFDSCLWADGEPAFSGLTPRFHLANHDKVLTGSNRDFFYLKRLPKPEVEKRARLLAQRRSAKIAP